VPRDWPRLAREAARAMTGVEPESDSRGTLLLRDLKAVFDERRDHLPSEEIVQALIEMEGRPWAEWRNGKPLTKNGLARLLAPFRIRPTKWREGDDILRGYNRSDFEEVFERYLEIEAPQTPRGPDSMTYKEWKTPHDKGSVADESSLNYMRAKGVTNVADGKIDVEREVFEI